MVNLSAEMAGLWTSLVALGDTRVVQVVAARRGEGASTVARELADYAARRMGRSVWLIDLDLFGSAQYSALEQAAERFGALGEPASASPDGSMFFTVQPQRPVTPGGRLRSDAEFLTAHRVGVSRWWVTRFRRDLLAAGVFFNRQTAEAPGFLKALLP
jgi:hypothetical protein